MAAPGSYRVCLHPFPTHSAHPCQRTKLSDFPREIGFWGINVANSYLMRICLSVCSTSFFVAVGSMTIQPKPLPMFCRLWQSLRTIPAPPSRLLANESETRLGSTTTEGTWLTVTAETDTTVGIRSGLAFKQPKHATESANFEID